MAIQGIATSDFKGLNELKVQAKHDAKQALPAVAKQFEGIFLQSMLKTMRMGQHFLDESSPFKGKNQDTFQEMLDGQYATNISNGKGLGLAAMLTQQLQGTANRVNANTIELIRPTVINKPAIEQVAQNEMQENDTAMSSVDDFVKSIWPKAKQAAMQLGLDPKILMAQAALETGWGKFVAKDAEGGSSNNLFNIKSANTNDFDSVNVKTTEYIANTPVKMNASFRKYASIEDSFNDYISLIKGNERYQNAVANAGNPARFVDELHKAGYATDPKYSSKILSIYHGDELNQAIQRYSLSGN